MGARPTVASSSVNLEGMKPIYTESWLKKMRLGQLPKNQGQNSGILCTVLLLTLQTVQGVPRKD